MRTSMICHLKRKEDSLLFQAIPWLSLLTNGCISWRKTKVDSYQLQLAACTRRRIAYTCHAMCLHMFSTNHPCNTRGYEVNSNRFEISSRFTWRFPNNFPNNSKTLLHMCKWHLLLNANLINAKKYYQW